MSESSGDPKVEEIMRAAAANETFPAGHFYSPVPDFGWLHDNASRALVYETDRIPGVELNIPGQLQLLETLGGFGRNFDWPDHRSPTHRYFKGNSFFSGGSAAVLYAMMMQHRPGAIIEIGSGFSSALMIDTRERTDYRHETHLTFIEPFPGRLNSLIRPEDRSTCNVIVDMVQNVDLAEFEKLKSGDILFIDSSHVARTASDVLFLFHTVLPALRSGVLVHIHDIYWPFEYPRSWLLEKKWAWNEAYFVRAFLQFNSAFEMVFFNHYLAKCHRADAERLFPVLAGTAPGSSLWLRRK
jgi:hypothetical protein